LIVRQSPRGYKTSVWHRARARASRLVLKAERLSAPCPHHGQRVPSGIDALQDQRLRFAHRVVSDQRMADIRNALGRGGNGSPCEHHVVTPHANIDPERTSVLAAGDRGDFGGVSAPSPSISGGAWPPFGG